MKSSVFFGAWWTAQVAMAPAAEDGWRDLFNGKDLEGWTVTVDGRGPGEDPERLVQVKDGAIHMYADTKEEAKVPFGVITHEGTFSRFHLSLEYRWAGKRFEPRKNALRDAGVLYHASNTHHIWPSSVECQIQEGDTGDLIFIDSAGLSWAHPKPGEAPEGQGDPSMLPEAGGVPKVGGHYSYFGRFPVLDREEGWNRVEVIAHADESAEHLVNGETVARLGNIQRRDGGVLKEGKICLQLEAAEIQYRNVRIRELGEPLRTDRRMLSLSAAADQPPASGRLEVHHPGERAVTPPISVSGKDADAFEVGGPGGIEAGGTGSLKVTFRPVRGAGRYSAGLQIGDKAEGAFVLLQGVGFDTFEGSNEPPLQSLVDTLGIPLKVGGERLSLDTKAAKIGDGVELPRFKAAGAGKVRITPLARFSPPGRAPIGIVHEGGEALVELGALADSEQAADAHQRLFPPLEGDSSAIEFDPPGGSFSFYMKGHQFTSFTDPELPTEAKIDHTARVFPVRFFQGEVLENAFLVGFEEASNGDYQDVVLLIENVTAP